MTLVFFLILFVSYFFREIRNVPNLPLIFIFNLYILYAFISLQNFLKKCLQNINLTALKTENNKSVRTVMQLVNVKDKIVITDRNSMNEKQLFLFVYSYH